MNGRLEFFQQFLRHPRQIGSIIPSSRFLERRVMEASEVRSAATVVELGAGTGGMTRAILNTLPSDSTLLSIEINPQLQELVRRIEDNRLITHLGDAGELESIMAQYGLGRADAVISGIPFSTMDRAVGDRVIQAVFSMLAHNGRFVAYQVSSRVATLCKPIQASRQVGIEFFNVPPMRVYRWQKTA